jgi:hypothetical protein
VLLPRSKLWGCSQQQGSPCSPLLRLHLFSLSSPLVSGAPAAIASACLPPDTSAEDLQAKVLPEVLDMRSLSKASTSRSPALAFSHIVPVDYEYE